MRLGTPLGIGMAGTDQQVISLGHVARERAATEDRYTRKPRHIGREFTAWVKQQATGTIVTCNTTTTDDSYRAAVKQLSTPSRDVRLHDKLRLTLDALIVIDPSGESRVRETSFLLFPDQAAPGGQISAFAPKEVRDRRAALPLPSTRFGDCD